MSTRATIRIYMPNGSVRSQYYKHMDGYPEGVGDFLKRALALVAQGFRMDTDCTTADALERILALYPQFEKEDPEICHTDIEWYYPVMCSDKSSSSLIKMVPVLPEFTDEQVATLLNIPPFPIYESDK